jgi:hypothetical protein
MLDIGLSYQPDSLAIRLLAYKLDNRMVPA